MTASDERERERQRRRPLGGAAVAAHDAGWARVRPGGFETGALGDTPTDPLPGTFVAWRGTWVYQAPSYARVSALSVGQDPDGALIWDAGTYVNGFAQFTIRSATPTNQGVGLRINRTGSSFPWTLSGYVVRVIGSTAFRISRLDAGNYVNLVSVALGVAVVAGDVLRIEVQGTAIRGYINGVQTGATANDGTYAGPGWACLTASNTVPRDYSDFSAGAL